MFHDVTDAHLALLEKFDDPKPDRMAHGLEYFGFEFESLPISWFHRIILSGVKFLRIISVAGRRVNALPGSDP
jgi:hypothetical protein